MEDRIAGLAKSPRLRPSRRARLAGSRRATTSRSRPPAWRRGSTAAPVNPVRWRGSLTLVLGADPETFTVPGGEPCADLAAWLVEPVVTVVEGGGPWDDYELERVILDHDGNERVLLVRARPVFDAGSAITGCVGVVADITADREAAQALQEQTDRYRLLLELSPDGIVVHEDGLIRWANQAAADFVGVADLNDYLGESLTQFIHPDSLLETLERIASLKEDEAATKPAEATLVRLDGSTIVVESLSVRTKWDGRPAYQVILRDLSLRKKAEEALRYQAKLVEHVSDAIIGLDADGRIDSWNPAAEQMYGWTCDAVIGRKFADVVGADPRLGLESAKHLETVHRRSDGTLLEVRISVALGPRQGPARSPARWPCAPTSPSAAAPRPRAVRSRSATPRSSRRSRKASSSATTRASSPRPTAPPRASSAGASWSASGSTPSSATSCAPVTPTAS